jgi:hypothetical protein
MEAPSANAARSLLSQIEFLVNTKDLGFVVAANVAKPSCFDKLSMRDCESVPLGPNLSLILSLSAFAKATADQENKTRPP